MGGSVAGDCEGEACGLVDGVSGAFAGEGGFVAVVVGDGAGALSARTLPEFENKKTKKTSTRSLCIVTRMNLK